MFRNKTVFVLGAGASCEAGLPLGSDLAEEISNLMDIKWNDAGHFTGGDREFSSFLNRFGGMSNYEQLAQEMSRGIRFSNSIDEYIERHNDNAHVKRFGKLAIANTILKREAISKVAVDSNNIYNSLETDKIKGTWYLEFARMLFRSTDRNSLDRLFGNLAIIDFNYDRCLDQFLRFAIKDGYGVDAPTADALLETLVHLRPYGSIGHLQSVAVPNGIAFGRNPHDANIEGVIGGIKTFSERVNTGEIDRIKGELVSAHTVVFLGFGFHEQNMRLIAPTQPTCIKKLLATAKSMSPDDRRIIGMAVEELCSSGLQSQDIAVRDLTCAELFKEYRLTLQAA